MTVHRTTEKERLPQVMQHYGCLTHSQTQLQMLNLRVEVEGMAKIF
jgi:hypothetical protein